MKNIDVTLRELSESFKDLEKGYLDIVQALIEENQKLKGALEELRRFVKPVQVNEVSHLVVSSEEEPKISDVLKPIQEIKTIRPCRECKKEFEATGKKTLCPGCRSIIAFRRQSKIRETNNEKFANQIDERLGNAYNGV